MKDIGIVLIVVFVLVVAGYALLAFGCEGTTNNYAYCNSYVYAEE